MQNLDKIEYLQIAFKNKINLNIQSKTNIKY